MDQSSPRPGQATLAGWLIIGGSLVLVITAWQRISTLHTLEVQEELQRVLAEPPVSGLGVGLEGLTDVVRVLCTIAALAATASAILGFYALRRSTDARLGLTLLAPLVLVGGFATAGFFAPMVVAGVVMLWLQPTRDWFAGRPWLATLRATLEEQRGPARPDPFGPLPQREEAEAEHREPARETDREPGPHPHPYGARGDLPSRPTYAPQPGRRPSALVWACVITWASCAITAGFMVLFSLIMAVAREEFFAEVERQQPDLDLGGVSRSDLAAGTYLMTAIVVVWCLGAALLAWFAFRRRAWGRTGLAVSSTCAGVLCLGFSLVSPLIFVLAAAGAATTWLLLRSDVTGWFRE